MPADSDLLFGKIAVARGFCTQDQVDACVKIQESSKEPVQLGRILVSEGHLSEDQYSSLLEIQREKLHAPDPIAQKNLDRVLFGRLVVSRGLLTEGQVNECLRLQAQAADERSLGEVMVSKGYLTPDQVRSILAEQCKTIMNCPPCGLSLTVLSTTRRKLIDCPRCKGPLVEGKPSDSTRTDAEYETKFAYSVKSEAAGEQDSEAAPQVDVTCKVCTHKFKGVLDSTNRASCPECHARFVVRPASG